MKHVHHQWKKYICEFCFLVEKAQGSLQKKTKRIAYFVCAILAVSGILLFALGYSNELGLTFLLGGFFGMAGVATSSNRMVGRPTRASDIDANIERRAFGYRDSE